MYYNLIYMKVFPNLFDVVYIIFKELCIRNYYKGPTTNTNTNTNNNIVNNICNNLSTYTKIKTIRQYTTLYYSYNKSK
jgi:hypothetical protein